MGYIENNLTIYDELELEEAGLDVKIDVDAMAGSYNLIQVDKYYPALIKAI